MSSTSPVQLSAKSKQNDKLSKLFFGDDAIGYGDTLKLPEQAV